MKTKHATKFNKILVILITVVFVMGNMISVAFADVADPLKPEDKIYENGNIVLHKQADRIAADEWRINVKADIKDSPVEPPKMEVVFVLDASGSMLCCTNEAVHNLGLHYIYDNDHSNCPIICGNSEHTHESSCYLCGLKNQMHPAMSKCYDYMDDGSIVHQKTRFELAKQVINNMISKFPEGTHVGRISFNDSEHAKYHGIDEENPEKDPYDSINPGGATYMMDGVRLALSHEECFTDDPSTQKIMIVVTDGLPSFKDKNGNESNDLSLLTEAEVDALYGVDDPQFNQFKDDGGIVYTVGFNHADENLTKMIANGGTYNRAADGAALENTFDQITAELTAMLIDPMGTAVGFERDSVQSPTSSVPGEVTYLDNTLYWNPTTNDSITRSSIEYSYTVKLNENANLDTGVHEGVKLNNPTNLLYGIKSSGATNMKTAAFPIPEATYAVSTMQVKWQYGDQNLKTPTDTEKFICDWEQTDFETDYKTITQEITVDGVTYYYAGTVITKNGEVVRQVVPTDAADYVVTHKYELQPVVLTYDVNYEYTGEVPAGAPETSSLNQSGVEAGTSVDVADEPSVEGYDFSGWKVVEGEATVEDGSFTMPEENVTLQGSFTKIKKATAVVHYVDEEGNTLKDDTVSDEIRVGNSYDVSEAKDVDEIIVNGKTYEFVSDGDAAYTGTISENGVEITRVYKLKTYNVNYGYTGEVPAGAPAASRFNQSGVEAGTSVDVADEPSVEGYDFSGWKVVEGEATVEDGSFTMPEENVTLQGSFTKIKKATAVVHYVDEDGNKLQDDTVSDEIRVGNSYDVSEAKDVNEITVDGKTYVFVSDNENAVYAGNMPEGGVEITRVYTLKSYYYKVLVNYFTSTNGGAYVKDNAEAVEYVGRTETKETSVNVDLTGALTYNGGTYANPALAEESAAATIAGNNVTFAPADDTAVVTVNLYRDVIHKATATVHYVDENGNKIKDDTTSGEVNVGSAYDLSEADAVNEIIYDGKTYVFVSDTDGAEYAGTMPDGGVDITRKYTLKSYSYNVFVNYFTSTNGGAYVKDNAEAVEYVELTETKETSVDVDLTDALTYGGNTYGKPALADGSAAATLADGKVTVGLGDDTAVVIVNLYRDVIHKATAVVHYVDTEGNTLQEDTVSDEINVGSAYDVSEAKDVSEIKANGKTYVFESESDNAIYTGTMPDGGVEITRVYRLVDPTDPTDSIEPTEPTTPTGDDTELNDSPSTGDQSMWLWMILLAASTCGIVVVLEGRKRSY